MAKMQFDEVMAAINDGRRINPADVAARVLRRRVWCVGTGQVGCLYDNAAVFATKRAAIEYAREIIAERGIKGVLRYLTKNGIAPLDSAGTEYVEVSCNTVADVIN